MNEIVLYKKKNCPLCDEVRTLVDLLELDFSIEFEEVDIEEDESLMEKYLFEIPVLIINGEELHYPAIDYMELKKRLH